MIRVEPKKPLRAFRGADLLTMRAEFLGVIHGNRVRRIESDHPMILHEDQRRLAVGARHSEEGIEADLQRAGLQLLVIVRLGCAAKAIVPLAERGGKVAGGFQQRRQSNLTLVKLERITTLALRVKVVSPAEERVTLKA